LTRVESPQTGSPVARSDMPLPAAPPLCEYLDWDSEFFGLRIARLCAARLDQSAAAAALQWCRRNRIDCLYFLADADDDATVQIAEASRFHFVDIRVTLEAALANRQQSEAFSSDLIRPAADSDLIHLREIARTSYSFSRFCIDSHFPVARSRALYETWIEKSCRGYADTVFVADIGGQAVGYISCNLAGADGQIGLVGVSAEHGKLGLGHALVEYALQWFQEQHAQHVRVVTQGRNSRALRLYEKSGFRTGQVQLWYHRWFSADESE